MRGLVEQIDHLEHARDRLAHVVQSDEIGCGTHVVDCIVELFGQRVDVLSIEGCDDDDVEPLTDRPVELVTPALGFDYSLGPLGAIGQVGHSSAQFVGTEQRILRRIVEHRVERLVAGD